MTIKDKKLEYLTEAIVRDQVKKGKLPTSSETINKLMAVISQEKLSEPSYKFSALSGKNVVESQVYSTYLDNILNDLQILYENFIYLQDTYVSNTRNYEVERQKLELQLQELEDKLREKIILSSDPATLNCIYDTFTDAERTSSDSQNIEVDIKNREVILATNGLERIPSSNIDKDNIAFSVRSMFESISQSTTGSLSNIINNQINEVWEAKVLARNNSGMGIVVQIDFTKAVDINCIELDLHTSKPLYVLLKFSPEGINKLDIPYNEEPRLISNRKTYTFPKLTMKTLYVEITGTECDDRVIVDNKDAFQYNFGIGNIAFFKVGYNTVGTFLSKPLVVEEENFVINQVALEVDDETALGTNIDYYIALNSEEPIWYRISPLNKTNPLYTTSINFKNVSDDMPTIFRLDSAISIKERQLANLKTNGIDFYRLGSIGSADSPISIIAGSEKLYKGIGVWELKRLASNYDPTYLPKIEDWFYKESQASTSYIPIEQIKILDGITGEKANYKLSITFKCTQAISIKAIPACSFPYTIYVNTRQVSSDNNLAFQKGFNQLDILIHKYDADKNLNLDLNLQPRLQDIGNSFYASNTPMTLVSLFDLQYRIPNTDGSYYAITEINGKNVVVVNNIIPDLNYEFHYQYSNADTDNGLLFKAILTRDDTIIDTTPKLNSYRIKLM